MEHSTQLRGVGEVENGAKRWGFWPSKNVFNPPELLAETFRFLGDSVFLNGSSAKVFIFFSGAYFFFFGGGLSEKNLVIHNKKSLPVIWERSGIY